MFANVQDFLTDPDVEKKGVALDMGDGRKIFVKRAGGANKRYGVRLSALMKPYKFQIDQGIIGEDKSREIMWRAASEELVCGWEGFKDEAGNDIPYSPENCLLLFAEAPDLYRFVVETASSIAIYRREALKSDVEALQK